MSAGGRDRLVGIVSGIVLGVAIIAGFVFFGSEGTIDAPRISGLGSGTHHPHPPPRPPLVAVRGGAPPPGGPAKLQTARGARVRFRLDTDSPLRIGVPGLGVSRSLGSGRTIVSFKATRRGQFPVIVNPSHISIATLRITRRGS